MDESAHTAFEAEKWRRGRPGGAGGASGFAHGADETAVLGLHAAQGGEGREDAEALGVGVVDAGEQGLSEAVDELVAEAAAHESGEGFVAGILAGGDKEFGEDAGLRLEGKEGGAGDGAPAGGSEHHHAGRDGVEVGADGDEGAGGLAEGVDEAIAEAEFAHEIGGPGLAPQDGVGAVLDDELTAAGSGLGGGEDFASPAGGGLEDGAGDGGLGVGKVPGGGEPGDAAADDGDVRGDRNVVRHWVRARPSARGRNQRAGRRCLRWRWGVPRGQD